MRARPWIVLAFVVSGLGAVACASSDAPTETAATGEEQDLIACGFIACPHGMRCAPTKDGGAPVDAGPDAARDDAKLRTYGVCVPDPCSSVHCLSGTTCVEKEQPNGMLTGSCERDPCAFIHCLGGMHCEPQDTAAGRMGVCVR